MSGYRSQDNVSLKARVIIFVSVFYIWALFMNSFTNPEKVPFLVGFPILGWLLFIILRAISRKSEKKRIVRLFEIIIELKQREYIQNFINRFSFEGKSTNSWEFRKHRIDWHRIDDLETYLIEKGVPLVTRKKWRDVLLILETYIQIKEENLTRESIKSEPRQYSMLSGSDFERLLKRLFEAMGYTVQLTGQSGDQGGDLIANNNGDRILIQAKCYRDWTVGNEAVQQVVGAMKYYDCNKSYVITTSESFTPQAHELAKANNTNLISKQQLSEMLLEYLNESWA